MLKRETRILGLSGTATRRMNLIVGVVYRGYEWLDGIVWVCVNERQNYNVELSRGIRSAKQFSQLHAIILSPELTLSRQIAITDLHERIRVPILAISKSAKGQEKVECEHGLVKFDHSIKGRHVFVAAIGVSKGNAEQLYNIGCCPGSQLPEAVRLARVLSTQLKGQFVNRKEKRVS